MRRAATLAFGVFALCACSGASLAADKGKPTLVSSGSVQLTRARYHRPRVAYARMYAGRRIGFYSYSYRDVINTYGMSRSLYGSINSYRDPYVDRQTPAGPFDHGFFFDSGTLPRGGNAPYMN